MAPQRSRGRPNKQQKKLLAASTYQPDEEDDEGLSMVELSLRKNKNVKMDIDRMFKNLELAANKLASLDNNEAFDAWLQLYGEDDADMLKKIEDSCSTVGKMLRARRSKVVDGDSTPEILKAFSKYFLYREGTSNFTLLAPVDVFNTDRDIRKKTFAFIREQGDDWPLKYAISGVQSCIKHQRVLDNDEWSPIAFNYGKDHGFESQGSGYERSSMRQKEKGTDFASHVERKLMLFFCTEKLRPHVKKDLSIEVLLKMSYKLRRFYPQGEGKSPLTAEIVLNRKPCANCEQFRDLVQEATGVQFKFMIIDTLGKCELVRNKHQHAFFQPRPEETLHISDDEDDALNRISASKQKSTSNRKTVGSTTKVLVVLQPMPKAPPPVRPVVREVIEIEDSSSPPQAPQKKRKLKDYMYKEPRSNSKHTSFETIDESEYKETYVRTSTSTSYKKSHLPRTPPSTARKETLQVAKNISSFAARLEAEKTKTKKRMVDLELSPTISRKQPKVRY